MRQQTEDEPGKKLRIIFYSYAFKSRGTTEAHSKYPPAHNSHIAEARYSVSAINIMKNIQDI